jgi:hypothetical protein
MECWVEADGGGLLQQKIGESLHRLPGQVDQGTGGSFSSESGSEKGHQVQ